MSHQQIEATIIKEPSDIQRNPGHGQICLGCSNCRTVGTPDRRGLQPNTVLPSLVLFTDGTEECSHFCQQVDLRLQPKLPTL